MKLMILAVSLAACIPFSVAAEPSPVKVTASSTKPTDPLKALAQRSDKMEGVTWYRHKTSPGIANANGVYLYFGKQDSGSFTPLHLKLQYHASNWLFVKDAWAKADGEKISLPQETKRFMGWERDNAGGSIWEWSDATVVSRDEIATVRKLAFAKNVTVRFEGRQYYDDKALTAQQLKAMREVIEAYEAATGTPWR